MKTFKSPRAFTEHPRVTMAFDAGHNLCPVNFADARRPNQTLFPLIAAAYETADAEHFAESYHHDNTRPDGAHEFRLKSHAVSERNGISIVRAVTESPHLRVTKKFTLDPNEPWLQMEYSALSIGVPMQGKASKLHLPALHYGAEMENPLDDALFDFSFGRILPDGLESPPYMTFWLEGHASAVLVWTKTKEAMRRLFPRDTLLAGVHPSLSNGSSATDDLIWDEQEFQQPWEWEFFLWPITEREWKSATRRLAGMSFPGWNPGKIVFPPKADKAGARPGSRIFSATEIAQKNPRAVADDGQPRRWWHIQNKTNQSLLFAQEPYTTAPLRISHGLNGRHRVWITVQSGWGVALRTSSNDYPLPLYHDGTVIDHPYYNSLLEPPKLMELDGGTWDLARGGILEVRPHPTMYAQSIVSAIRFEPIPQKESSPKITARSPLAIYGIADSPDIAQSDGAPNDKPYRANVIEHARLGYKRLYWRADGQCCDFHTRVGTVRYPLRRTHSVFTPNTLSYGVALAQQDLLVAAVEEAHRHDLELYGYMRLNSYTGNATAQFYLEHPELHDVMENGLTSSRMCYYLPEYRRWKVEIAREIVQRGVDGLLLDLTRTPQMVDYHPRVVDAYTYTNGVLPPRNLQRGWVSYGVHPLETGEEWTRWWKFRAEGFTDFGRELRTMLAQEGKPDLPIHVQVRPKMALFDGLNLQRWIDEGLIDLLHVWPEQDLSVPEEIFETAQGRIPVRCTVALALDAKTFLPRIEKVLNDKRYEGLTIYESNAAVWSPLARDLMESLA